MPTRYTRRAVLSRMGGGFGGLVLASLLGEEAARGADLAARPPHYPARARAVISSTLPVPLILRYFGAAASPVVAHAE